MSNNVKIKNTENTENLSAENLSYETLVENSIKFQSLKKQIKTAAKLSLTGITNLVVNHEDPCLVESFLKNCWKLEDLYKETFDIDAVELQKGAPGRGFASQYLDILIFGGFEEEDSGDGLGVKVARTNPQNGRRKRKPDGFVNRKEVLTGKTTKGENFKDRLLVIKNIDYCVDFCQHEPGTIDARALWLLDNFRNPSVKMGCRILLVTNKPLKLPFKIRTVKIDPVDEYEANHIIDSFTQLYKTGGYKIDFTASHRRQLVRKICGLTYTEAGDAIAEALSTHTETFEGSKEIDSVKALKNLREKVNRNFMEDAVGLTHLTARPWEDYICPKSSNFTYDVNKIVRDFNEIDNLKKEAQEKSKVKGKFDVIEKNIDGIRGRMPHVIILYGKGGVGKSAFPIHFAGLLDFDVWDFNIGASHSKWVGEGPERMREALAKISKASHLIVRIDEYDRAIGSTESSGQGMHEAHKQVEAEFMNWLQNSQEDNFFVKNDIFIIMTTNHKDNITGPLLRSGRADLVIDIADFDEESMRETFLSAPRRMSNRGVVVVGFDTTLDLEKAIQKLDLDKLVSLAADKGFTVRDVDVMLQEMATHNYYYKKSQKGIPWTTDSFVKVLERSVGSVNHDNETTGELVLGDRFLLEECEKKFNPQLNFEFLKDYTNEFDLDEFKNVSFFE